MAMMGLYGFSQPPHASQSQGFADHNEEENKEGEITSRKGYLLKDLARAFTQTMGEAGPIASGKLIHYTADMITSGGIQLWKRLCWEYAFDHIGVASPRIFHYLQKKTDEMDEMIRKLTFEQMCHHAPLQQLVTEVVLILQLCPKKAKAKYPSVPYETHENENWLRSVLRTSDKAVVRRVWNHDTDMEPMLHAGNEMVYAMTEGATERALFWVKWLIEEDAILRKKYQSGLSTAERGPGYVKPHQKTAMGFYWLHILAEAYKEMASKGMIRMHEEFQALLDLYRSMDPLNTQKRKMDLLVLMVQIITDVPRWKVPAAPSLVPDPAWLQRAVQQSDSFFKEILRYPLPKKLLPAKVSGLKQKKKKEPTKEEKLQQQLDMMDQMAMGFYKM